MLSVKIGSQKPTFEVIPDSSIDYVDGEDAAAMSSDYGLTLDVWQSYMLKHWLARDSSGRLSATTCGASVPRQNGKNGAIEALELYEMVVLGRRILHTAHEVKTSRKAFARLLSFFENPLYPDLTSMVKNIRKTNGQEAIYLEGGGSIEFIARSKSSGRGFTVDTLVLDESQELSEEALEALQPTISSAPSGEPRRVIVGTPPSSLSDGEVFQRVYDSAHAGEAPRSVWMEWAASHDDDIHDPEVWYATNPSLGIRLDPDTVRDELSGFSEASFKRERLGVWGVQDNAESALDSDDWNNCQVDSILPTGNGISLGIDVSPSRRQASLVASGKDVEGKTWVDVIESRQGDIRWIIPLVKKITSDKKVVAVVIDAGSPAGSLIDVLTKEGIEVTTLGTNLVIQAVGGFYDAVVSGSLRHLGQSILTAAALSAGKRKIGQAWGWKRPEEGTDITPLVGATLAHFGLGWTKAKPATKVKKRRRKAAIYL